VLWYAKRHFPRGVSNDVTWGNISLILQNDLRIGFRASDRVDGGTQEEQVNDYVGNLLKNVKARHWKKRTTWEKLGWNYCPIYSATFCAKRKLSHHPNCPRLYINVILTFVSLCIPFASNVLSCRIVHLNLAFSDRVAQCCIAPRFKGETRAQTKQTWRNCRNSGSQPK
jgi:hypothetical protein